MKLPVVYPLLLIEVHVHIFEFLLLFATNQYDAETLQTSDNTLQTKTFPFLHVYLGSHSTQHLNELLTLSTCSNPYSPTILHGAHVQSHTDARL